jgi:phytoene dehydrogenase-like protein
MGLAAMRVNGLFRGVRARALFAGIAAHSCLPLYHPVAAAMGLVLQTAGHAVGWPFPRGGSQRIADALIDHLRKLKGDVAISSPVRSIGEIRDSDAILCDVTPRQLLAMAGEKLPEAYRSALQRYRYGPGAYKVDWALDGAVPWRAAECARAATVHVGGTFEEIAASESDAWNGRVSERPFVLAAQPSLFDSSRAPTGKHTLWGYCHVPNGSSEPMVDRIEAQIERFAPGFRERILARSVKPPAELEAGNANLVGGDINGGMMTVAQFVMRPTWRKYRTPLKSLYLCSSSTPPGGGVHGMCGYWAAKAALEDAV